MSRWHYPKPLASEITPQSVYQGRREFLRIDEAMHPLTLLGFGLYGEVLPCNGYAEQMASLYSGMDLQKWF